MTFAKVASSEDSTLLPGGFIQRITGSILTKYSGIKMDRKKIARAVRMILEAIGEDPERAGLKDTPKRVAEMCTEIFAGVAGDPEVKSTFSETAVDGDGIEIRGIEFHSICEHHLLPFFGTIDIYYIPRAGRIAGFSDFTALVEGFARRPQIQERLTAQIADTLMQQLRPRGVMVVVRARQLCASMRGKHPRNIETVTEARRGDLDPLQCTGFRQS